MLLKMPRKLLSLIIIFLLIVSPILSTAIIKVKALNTTYYVSYSGGNDNNDGTSQASAWKTLSKVSSQTFSQGDQILLKSGDVWTNSTLTLKGSGTSTNPIILSSYGTGNLPKISPNIIDSNCIYASGVDGWKIMNMELCNAKDGIHFDYDNSFNHNYLWIQNCNIHDLDGTYNSNPELFNHFSCGISINGFSSGTKQTILSDITVTNITYRNVNISWFDGTPFNRCNSSTGFSTGALAYISDCNLSNMSITNGGQGGYMFMCMSNATITNCDTYNTGFNSFPYGSAGIVVGHCNNIVLDGCDVSYAHRNAAQDWDGMGVDFDGGYDNYNLTYKNAAIEHTDGAGFTLFDSPMGSLGTQNALIDHVSISYFGENPSNHSAAINFGGSCSTGKIQNCVFNKSISSRDYFDGPTDTFTFTNNQFCTNISSGKATAVSSYATGNAGFDGSKAVDGDTTTYWCANGYVLPSWLTVDLGSTYQITNINQLFVNSSNWKFRIDVSSDNSTWKTIVNNTTTSVNGMNFSYNVNDYARYVRLYITGSDNGAWANSEEFDVYGTPATNIAAGKTTSVSSYTAGFDGYDGSKAVDGNGSTYWCSNGYILPSWLTVDLGSSYQITNIDQIFYDSTDWKFRIDVSSDNITWQTIVDNTVTSVNGTEFSYDVNAYGRYIRLYITGNTDGAWATSKEFSVYGIPEIDNLDLSSQNLWGSDTGNSGTTSGGTLFLSKPAQESWLYRASTFAGQYFDTSFQMNFNMASSNDLYFGSNNPYFRFDFDLHDPTKPFDAAGNTGYSIAIAYNYISVMVNTGAGAVLMMEGKFVIPADWTRCTDALNGANICIDFSKNTDNKNVIAITINGSEAEIGCTVGGYGFPFVDTASTLPNGSGFLVADKSMTVSIFDPSTVNNIAIGSSDTWGSNSNNYGTYEKNSLQLPYPSGENWQYRASSFSNQYFSTSFLLNFDTYNSDDMYFGSNNPYFRFDFDLKDPTKPYDTPGNSGYSIAIAYNYISVTANTGNGVPSVMMEGVFFEPTAWSRCTDILNGATVGIQFSKNANFKNMISVTINGTTSYIGVSTTGGVGFPYVDNASAVPNGSGFLVANRSMTATLSNPTLTSSVYKISTDNIITNMKLGTTFSQLRAGITAGGETVIFKDAQGNNILDEGAVIGTGSTVTIANEINPISYSMLIYGDVNGDGMIDLSDLVIIRDYLLNGQQPGNIFKSAGDLYGEGNITLNDLVGIMADISGVGDIRQDQAL